MAQADRDTALTTSAAVKTYLSITSTSEGSRIDSLVLSASDAISVFCDRKFAQASYEVIFDGDSTAYLWLPHFPITQPMADANGIWLDSDRTFPASTKLEEDIFDGTGQRDYIIVRDGNEEGGGRIDRVNGTFGKTAHSVKVKWQGGYATIPSGIAQIAIELVATWKKIGDDGLHGIDSVSFPAAGGSITSFNHDDIPDHLKRRLFPWKRVRIR